MAVTWLIAIGNDDDDPTGQMLGVLTSPLPCATRIARRYLAHGDQGIRILLPFNDPDPLAVSDPGHRVGYAVEHPWHPCHGAGPGLPARGVHGDPLGFPPPNFVQQLTSCVEIGVPGRRLG